MTIGDCATIYNEIDSLYIMILNLFRSKLPQIIIKYGKLLDPIFIFYCQNNPDLKERGWNNWIPPTQEEIFKKIEDYKNEWSEHEARILKSMCAILGLEFKRNAIDVYIVSGNPRQLSAPIVIKSGFTPDEFVDSLTHELIHALFGDNGKIVPISIWDEMFPGETKLVKSHAVVHSVLKYIYLDVLKDDKRLEKNIAGSKKHDTNDYFRAWEIVDEKGYTEIIKKFKSKIKRGLSMF